MKRLALALVLAAAAATAHARSGAIVVRDAWSRPAAAGTTAAGFMTLENRGDRPDALVGVTTDIAKAAQIHRSAMAGGIMSMSQETRVELPPHGSVAFAPGGYHLMFTDLKRPLKSGEKLHADLDFASGRHIRVAFEVRTDAPASTR